jgi:SOS response regulatory protein OraA/RecX
MNELRNRLTAPRMSANKIDKLCDHLTKAHDWIEKVEDAINSREYEEGIENLDDLADRLEDVMMILTDDRHPKNAEERDRFLGFDGSGIEAAIEELREAESTGLPTSAYPSKTDELLTVVKLLKGMLHEDTLAAEPKDRVANLYGHTHDAYSRPHFTDSGWRKTIHELVARGFTDSQITMLMMSKHIRWAVDSAEKRRNKYTSTLILNYLDKSYANGTFFPEDWDALGFTDDGCVSSDL